MKFLICFFFVNLCLISFPAVAENKGLDPKELQYKALYANEIELLKSLIVLHHDFPKPGVLFADFSPLLSHEQAFQKCINLLYERYKEENIEGIVGLEARGFILGAALAYKLKIGFIPIRKPGKLPGAVYTVSYEKEYGFDSLTISQKALKPKQRILIIDDLIATGGTAKAAVDLVKLAGGNPVEFASIFEVKALGGPGKIRNSFFQSC